MSRRLVAILCSALCLGGASALVACGIEQMGTLPEGGDAGDDASRADAAADAPVGVADGGVTCAPEPTPPGAVACPAECTGGCQPGNLCVIDCAGQQKCQRRNITCPPAYACEIRCSGTEACRETVIACPPGQACALTCAGEDGCEKTQLNCGGAGACSVDCQVGQSVCSGTSVRCGGGPCSAKCGPSRTRPAMDCQSACACKGC